MLHVLHFIIVERNRQNGHPRMKINKKKTDNQNKTPNIWYKIITYTIIMV